MTTIDWRFILNKVRGHNCSGHYNATGRTVVGAIAPVYPNLCCSVLFTSEAVAI
jgi:hypothetical protein